MNWSELIEATKSADWPSIDDQEFAKDGLTYLQDFLGERVLNLKSYHPYFSETYNTASWNLQRYAEFGHRIRTLCSVTNFPHRFRQLRQTAKAIPTSGRIEKFFSLFYEIEMAYPFVKQDIVTEFFQEAATPTPDFRIKINDRWLNMEITNLRDPASYWDAEKFKMKLRDTIVENFSNEPWFLQIGIGRLWDDIKRSQNETILEIIEELRKLLNSSSAEDQINLRGIQIYFFRMGAALTMAPLEGPQWLINYPQKIRNSIFAKSKQLLSHAPAIIVICDCVFNFSEIPKLLPNLVQFVEYIIKPMSHISGVMLVFDKTNMFGICKWPIEKPDFLFEQYLLCHDTRLLAKLLIPNPGAEELLTPKEIYSLLAYPNIIKEKV